MVKYEYFILCFVCPIMVAVISAWNNIQRGSKMKQVCRTFLGLAEVYIAQTFGLTLAAV